MGSICPPPPPPPQSSLPPPSSEGSPNHSDDEPPAILAGVKTSRLVVTANTCALQSRFAEPQTIHLHCLLANCTGMNVNRKRCFAAPLPVAARNVVPQGDTLDDEYKSASVATDTERALTVDDGTAGGEADWRSGVLSDWTLSVGDKVCTLHITSCLQFQCARCHYCFMAFQCPLTQFLHMVAGVSRAYLRAGCGPAFILCVASRVFCKTTARQAPLLPRPSTM